jgi:hypothetical protein
MTLREKQSKFAVMVAQLIVWCQDQGYELTLGEAYRTKEQQEIYVQQGKSQTMRSKHLTRLAIDLNLFSAQGKYQTSASAYAPLGAYWKSLDPENVWGGDWKSFVDAVHFQSF